MTAPNRRTPEAQAAYRARKGAAYALMHRKHQRDHEARHPEKRAARVAARKVAGKIVATHKSCPNCGKAIGGGNRIELHHTNYAKPTTTKTVCSSCHPKGGWTFKRGSGVGSSM